MTQAAPELVHVSDGACGAIDAYSENPPLLATADASPAPLNTLRLVLRPVASFRLDDPRFHFDSSFVHPGAKEDFVAFADLASSHPRHRYVVYGHADPVGRDDYNKRLSGRRAKAVYAVLTRRVDLWEDLYSNAAGGDAWGHLEIQTMLEALGYQSSTPTNKDSNDEKVAVEAFQGDHTDKLKVDGKCGEKTRAELFRCYMDYLCEPESQESGESTESNPPAEPFSLKPTDFLGQGKDAQGKGDYYGCGEANPVFLLSKDESAKFEKQSDKTERDRLNSVNRRVVIMVFRPNAKLPSSWPCPRVSEGDGDCKSHFWGDAKTRRSPRDERTTFGKSEDTFGCQHYHQIAFDVTPERMLGCRRLQLRVIDHYGKAAKGAVAVVWIDDVAYRTAAADSEGNVRVTVPDGKYGVETWDGDMLETSTAFTNFEGDAVSDMEGISELDQLDAEELPGTAIESLVLDIDNDPAESQLSEAPVEVTMDIPDTDEGAA
jgi:hypothetical protein